MADIEIQCGKCKRAFEVSEYLQVDEAPCPQCATPVVVRKTKPESAGKHKESLVAGPVKLELKPKCPSCQATMEAGSVLCVACGYDTRSGKITGRSRPRGVAGTLKTIVILVAVAAVLFVLARFLGLVDFP